MLTFSKILHFPATYKKRNENLKTITLNNFKPQIISNLPLMINYSAKVNNHNPIIQTIGKLNNNTPVIITCTCESFKFEFAKLVHKEGSLFDPENFVLKQPKEKNPFGIAGPCKHILFLANYIWANRSKLNI